jgi:hypothetical protein
MEKMLGNTALEGQILAHNIMSARQEKSAGK